MKNYPVEGVKVVILSNEKMRKEVEKWYKPIWLSRFIGGYYLNKTVYIKESRMNDVKLFNHEMGHARGFSHTWYPTLMNPSWVGRWFNIYYPYKEVGIRCIQKR